MLPKQFVAVQEPTGHTCTMLALQCSRCNDTIMQLILQLHKASCCARHQVTHIATVLALQMYWPMLQPCQSHVLFTVSTVSPEISCTATLLRKVTMAYDQSLPDAILS